MPGSLTRVEVHVGADEVRIVVSVSVKRKPKRTRVPTLSDCDRVIERESGYWLSKFRGRVQRDDLRQEGTIVALKVIDAFDPVNGTLLTTYLTTALRRHFRRYVREVLDKALAYTEEQRESVREHVRVASIVRPMSDDVRLLLMRLRRLPSAQRALARDLGNADGKLRRVARQHGWSLRDTQRRVDRLRAAVKGRTLQ